MEGASEVKAQGLEVGGTHLVEAGGEHCKKRP